VAEGTVRIGAYAFAGSDVKSVVLPSSVASIGHKAFYACDNLQTVTFSSYDAPVLEEEYDYNYFISYENISGSGEYEFLGTDGVTEIYIPGLGITPYFLWNASESPTSVYYGATFVDHIGHYRPDLEMVYPVNGQNYDSFIMDQYFSFRIHGAAAADRVTQHAIDLINALPETVRLEDEEAVLAARAAYEQISTAAQKVLVSNYTKLTGAEKRIEDLKFLYPDPNDPTQEPTGTEPGTPDEPTPVPVLIGLIVVLLAGAAVFFVLGSKFRPGKEETQEED
jgi:hypothetical protein